MRPNRSMYNVHEPLIRKKCVFLPCFPANLLISNSVSLFITLLAVSPVKRESLDPLCSLCNFSAFVGSWRNTAEHDVTGRPMTARVSTRFSAIAGCDIILAKSGRLELGDYILGHYRSIFNHCDIIGLKICRIRWKKCKIRAITASTCYSTRQK